MGVDQLLDEGHVSVRDFAAAILLDNAHDAQS